MERWFAVNKTLAFAFGPGGLRPRVGKGFQCRSRPISRKPHSTCPLRKYTVSSTHNICQKNVVVSHIVQSTASVRTPTLGGCRRNVVCRLLGDRICSLSHRIQHGVRNIAAQPSPTHLTRRKRLQEKNLLMRFSFHGGFTASHHASIVVILQNVSYLSAPKSPSKHS